MIVVDASVAVKWFVPEKDTEQAEALLFSPSKLIAPELIAIEVAAALTRLLRTKELTHVMSDKLLNDWKEALIDETVTTERDKLDFDSAIQLSIDIGHQLQDCLYLALANRLGVPLITADEKFLGKAQSAGHNVIALSEQA